MTPDPAARLDRARRVGPLSLVLLNQVDPRPAATPGATRHSVLGMAAEPAPPGSAAAAAPLPAAPGAMRTAQLQPAAPARYCIGVIDGNRSSKECL